MRGLTLLDGFLLLFTCSCSCSGLLSTETNLNATVQTNGLSTSADSAIAVVSDLGATYRVVHIKDNITSQLSDRDVDVTTHMSDKDVEVTTRMSDKDIPVRVVRSYLVAIVDKTSQRSDQNADGTTPMGDNCAETTTQITNNDAGVTSPMNAQDDHAITPTIGYRPISMFRLMTDSNITPHRNKNASLTTLNLIYRLLTSASPSAST